MKKVKNYNIYGVEVGSSSTSPPNIEHPHWGPDLLAESGFEALMKGEKGESC